VASKSKKVISYLRARPWIELLSAIASFFYLYYYLTTISQFPDILNETVAFQTASVLVTAEGVLIALAPMMKNHLWAKAASVLVGVPAILISVITVATASFQSVQLLYISSAHIGNLFKWDAGLFGLLVEVYIIGILDIPTIVSKRAKPESSPNT